MIKSYSPTKKSLSKRKTKSLSPKIKRSKSQSPIKRDHNEFTSSEAKIYKDKNIKWLNYDNYNEISGVKLFHDKYNFDKCIIKTERTIAIKIKNKILYIQADCPTIIPIDYEAYVCFNTMQSIENIGLVRFFR